MVVLLALWGCSSDPLIDTSPASLIGPLEPLLVEVIPHEASAPLQTYVRQVNTFGVATAGSNPTLTVGGRAMEISLDGLGYGELHLSTVGLVEVEGAELAGAIHVLPRQWAGLPLSPVHAPMVSDPTLVASVGDAILVAADRELWWVPPDGIPHRVLEADTPLEGVRGVEIDVDGTRDAVAWTSQRVFLLRGRLQGGMSWGAAWEATGLSVGGVDVGDLSGDNLPDVAIAWADVDNGTLDVWEGDGLWNFVPSEPRPLSLVPVDVSVGDNTGEGRAQLTVVQTDGSWSRFVDGGEGQYIQVGPLRPQGVAVPGGTRAFSGADMDGNDADELLLVGPRDAAQARELFLFDFYRGLEVLTRSYVDAYFTVGDGDGNGSPDLWFSVLGGQLGTLRFDRTGIDTGVFREIVDTARLPEHGPIVVDAFLGDDVYGDLVVLGDRYWWWLRGTSTQHMPGLPDAPDGEFWLLDTEPLVPTGEGFAPMLLGWPSPEGRSADTVVVARQTVEGVELQSLTWETESQGWSVLGGQSLGDKGYVVTDATNCGSTVWVLGDGLLRSFDLSSPEEVVFLSSVTTTGTRVACGEGPDGAVALVVESDRVRLFDGSLSQVGERDAPGVVDATFIDFGDGPEVETCEVSGCAVMAWSKPGATEGLVVSTPDALEWIGPSGSVTPLEGGGTPTKVDMDRDGQPDLLSVSSDADHGSLLVFHRGTQEGLAGPEAYSTPVRWVEHAVILSEVEAEGEVDVLAVGVDGVLYRSRSTVPEASTTETTTPDTGMPIDTGLPADTGLTEDTGV